MVIVAINDKNKAVGEAKLPSSKRALNDFFSTFNEPVQAVVECTSFWYWLRREWNFPYVSSFENDKGHQLRQSMAKGVCPELLRDNEK